MAKEVPSTKVITGKVRLSYPHLFKPQKQKNEDGEDGEAKYKAVFLIPKTSKKTLKALETAVQNAMELGMSNGTYKGKPPHPKTMKGGVRDGDDKEGEEFQNHFFVNANSKLKPSVIHIKGGKDITDPDEVYAGCWVQASLSFYPYNWKGSKGVGCSLNSVMFVEDGERFAGRESAQVDFADYIKEDDGEEDDAPPPVKKTSSNKPAAAKKKAAPVDEEDDDEFED